MADVLVSPRFAFLRCQIEVSVSARHDQCQHREVQIVVTLLPLFKQHRMDVPLQMVYSNERLIESEGQRLGVTDTDQQRSSKTRPLRDRQCVDGLVSLPCILQRLSYNRNNGAKMLARCQLRHHTSIRLVSR